MTATRPNSEDKANSEREPRAAEPSNGKSIQNIDPALLGFLSARYYRREAVEHFLCKWHHRVPLSIEPPWFAKMLVPTFMVALIAIIGVLHTQIDFHMNGTFVTVGGRPALAIPAAAPVAVGATLTVSLIPVGEVKVVSIKSADSRAVGQTSVPVIPAADTQVVLLNRGPLPPIGVPVSVQLKSVRVINLVRIALKTR
jgi:hypothetical protein